MLWLIGTGSVKSEAITVIRPMANSAELAISGNRPGPPREKVPT